MVGENSTKQRRTEPPTTMGVVPTKIVIPAKAGIQEYLGFLSSCLGIIIMIVMVLSLFCAPAGAAIKPGTLYVEGNLTMEVQNAGLSEILEAIARTAGVDVFVARGFLPGGRKMSIKIADEPLDDVLRQILRGYNYAAIYVKEGDDFRVASIKIYPEGQQGRDMIPLFTGGRAPVYEEKNRRGETFTVLVNTGGDIITRGNMAARKGTLGPSNTEVAANASPAADMQSPWFTMQMQAEQDEAERFGELLLLRKQAESATDPERRQALTAVYADQMAKFEALKRANYSKIESLKRISQFQEVTAR